MAWSTSTRSARLPDDWPRRREQVRRRAGGRCQGPTDPATGRPHPELPRCTREGSECDHIKPGDDHRLANLQWLCADCHAAKTKRDAAEAARAWRQRAKRPAPRHPGLIASEQQSTPTPEAPREATDPAGAHEPHDGRRQDGRPRPAPGQRPTAERGGG